MIVPQWLVKGTCGSALFRFSAKINTAPTSSWCVSSPLVAPPQRTGHKDLEVHGSSLSAETFIRTQNAGWWRREPVDTHDDTWGAVWVHPCSHTVNHTQDTPNQTNPYILQVLCPWIPAFCRKSFPVRRNISCNRRPRSPDGNSISCKWSTFIFRSLPCRHPRFLADASSIKDKAPEHRRLFLFLFGACTCAMWLGLHS